MGENKIMGIKLPINSFHGPIIKIFRLLIWAKVAHMARYVILYDIYTINLYTVAHDLIQILLT